MDVATSTWSTCRPQHAHVVHVNAAGDSGSCSPMACFIAAHALWRSGMTGAGPLVQTTSTKGAICSGLLLQPLRIVAVGRRVLEGGAAQVGDAGPGPRRLLRIAAVRSPFGSRIVGQTASGYRLIVPLPNRLGQHRNASAGSRTAG